MKKTALFLFLLIFGWCSNDGFAQESIPPGSTVFTFVDAHVHLNDLVMQTQLMNEHQIERAVIFWGRSSDNELLLEAAKANPDMFFPFASISPERRRYRSHWEEDDVTILDELEDYLKTGFFKGIGEISVVHFPSQGFPEADYSPLGNVMKGIMRLAEQYDVPVNIHCEITRLAEFSQLLEAFAQVQVIWAHGGYTPYFLAKRMLEKHSNLTYELSARTYANHPRSPDYTIFRNESKVWPQWLELIESNPERFVIGTDASHRRISTERRKIERVHLLLAQLRPETRKMVASENMNRLMRR